MALFKDLQYLLPKVVRLYFPKNQNSSYEASIRNTTLKTDLLFIVTVLLPNIIYPPRPLTLIAWCIQGVEQELYIVLFETAGIKPCVSGWTKIRSVIYPKEIYSKVEDGYHLQKFLSQSLFYFLLRNEA
jgi:hypothetical protein